VILAGRRHPLALLEPAYTQSPDIGRPPPVCGPAGPAIPCFSSPPVFDWGPVVLQTSFFWYRVPCPWCDSTRKSTSTGWLPASFSMAWPSGTSRCFRLDPQRHGNRRPSPFFPRKLSKALNLRNLTVASIAFCLGAAPPDLFITFCFPLEGPFAPTPLTPADDVAGKSPPAAQALSTGAVC